MTIIDVNKDPVIIIDGLTKNFRVCNSAYHRAKRSVQHPIIYIYLLFISILVNSSLVGVSAGL